MSDDWDFYQLLVDDEPASIFLDMGIARKAPVPGFEHMAYLRVKMRNPREDGLSSDEEYDSLVALEDGVTTKIQQESPTLYVGRNTSSGNRDLYFYTRDETQFVAVAESAMASFSDYKYETGARLDRSWKSYFGFLYPSGISKQQMSDRQLLNTLEAQGDRSDEPRTIDHIAYFPDQDSCKEFARTIVERGFAIRPGTPELRDGQFAIEFTRVDRPADVPDITGDLFKSADELNGDYDGWGCAVLR